jgi:hypothetical protein
LYIGLNAGFELNREVVVIDRDPLDQPPDEAKRFAPMNKETV